MCIRDRGSHDATNSIPNKDLSIITPISLDHEIFLGETIKKIATEKLGIINHKSTVVFSPLDNSVSLPGQNVFAIPSFI